MKKFYYLIIVTVILGLVLTGCSLLSNVGQVPATGQSGIAYLTKTNGELYTEANPFTTDLLAGQNTDVGEVQVWNDAEYLHITYIIDALGWYLTETHLHVACDESAIPQNKKGNPIPGHFEYSSEHEISEEVIEEPFVISLDSIGCCSPFIAAHAVVVRAIPGCSETVWQIGDVETNECNGGLPTNYADEFNWGDPAGPCTAGPSLAVEQPLFANPFIIGSTLDSEFPYNSNTSKKYATDFDVQWDGELPFGGELLVSWSPGQSATEIKVVSDGFGTTNLTAIGTPTAGGFLNKYPLVQHSITVGQLSLGTHTINFRHTQGDGTFWDWIRLEKPCEQWETAWGYGDRFVKPGNWATYFSYPLQPVCPCIESYSENIKVLASPPLNVRAGMFEDTDYIKVWKEFEGTLSKNLYYDLDGSRSAKSDGPSDLELYVPAGTPVCIYYVHYDQKGGTYSPKDGIDASMTFGDNILGLIISGGTLGDFADRDFMFAADVNIGNPGTKYPDKLDSNNHARGFDVNWSLNTDDAVFNGATVDFNVWVANAHDSMRVILPRYVCE